MGRIKLGQVKGNRPVALNTFRFTSSDEVAINTIASVYGGNVTRQGHTFEVVTNATEIAVLLPDDPLGGTPIYELWSKAGLQRRCDGQTAMVARRTDESVEFVETPCPCDMSNRLECKPTTRLSVIIPQVRLGGVWTMTTKAWAAATEMEAMVELIRAAQERGLVNASLRLEPRVKQGKNFPYIVPVLTLNTTVAELISPSSLQAPLPPQSIPALPTATEPTKESLKQLYRRLVPEQKQMLRNWAKDEGIDLSDLTDNQLVRVFAVMREMVDEAEAEF